MYIYIFFISLIVTTSARYNPIICFLSQFEYNHSLISSLSCKIITILCLLSNTLADKAMKFSLIGILSDNLSGFIDIIINNLKEYDIILTTGVVTLLRVIFETQPGLSGYIISQLTVPINKSSDTEVTKIPVEGIIIILLILFILF